MRQVVTRLKVVRAVQGHRGGERSARSARSTQATASHVTPSAELRFKDLSYRTALYGLLQIAYSIKWVKESYQLMNGDTICLVVSVRGGRLGRLGRAHKSRASLTPAVPLYRAHAFNLATTWRTGWACAQ